LYSYAAIVLTFLPKKLPSPGNFFRLGVCVLSTHIAEPICMLIFHKAKSATGN
jgi:hypothetical protein